PLYVLPGFVDGTPFVLNAPIPINSKLDNDKFTYRAALEWDVAPRSLLYLSYETGYRSGGFSFARGLETYLPEEIKATTLGSKNRFFDNRLQLNVELFRWKYTDQQYSQFGYDRGNPPATVFVTRNIGDSTNQGVDIELQLLATPNTLIGATVQYLDAEYDSFVYFTPNQGCDQHDSVRECRYRHVFRTAHVRRAGRVQVLIDRIGRSVHSGAFAGSCREPRSHEVRVDGQQGRGGSGRVS